MHHRQGDSSYTSQLNALPRSNNVTYRSTLVGAAFAVAAHCAAAQGFVGGIPAGWTCPGNCGVAGVDGDVTLAPTGAAQYGYVVTGETTPTGLSTFVLPGGTATIGSLLRSISFTATAGDLLKFNFNYITSDGDTYSDYGWARLLNASNLSLAALLFTARTKPSGSIVPGQDLLLPQATLTPASVPISPTQRRARARRGHAWAATPAPVSTSGAATSVGSSQRWRLPQPAPMCSSSAW